MINALIDRFGLREGLTVENGEIVQWPYLEEKPSESELDKIVKDYEAQNKKLEAKEKAKNLYSQIENHFLIVANNRTYNFDISKKIDFFAKFVLMPDDGAISWTAHNNIEYSHTKEEAGAVIASAELFLTDLFNAKKLDKNGDGSLSNLKAIQEAQKILGGE
jgi:hypothetical protein